MYKIENTDDKYGDVARYLKENKDTTDHITIAMNDGKVEIQKDLLLLTSPLMRDILASYPANLEPLIIFPDNSFKCKAVEKVSDFL